MPEYIDVESDGISISATYFTPAKDTIDKQKYAIPFVMHAGRPYFEIMFFDYDWITYWVTISSTKFENYAINSSITTNDKKEFKELVNTVLDKHKLNKEIVEFPYKRAANRIKEWWVRIFWDPDTKIGRKRLERSYEDEDYSVW